MAVGQPAARAVPYPSQAFLAVRYRAHSSAPEKISSGVRISAAYTVESCVRDWIDALTLDPDTVAAYRGQAEKWIYPKLGAIKLKDLRTLDVERFFTDLGHVLSKRSLVMINSTLRRSIRRAQKHDLIARNVAELADLAFMKLLGVRSTWS